VCLDWEEQPLTNGTFDQFFIDHVPALYRTCFRWSMSLICWRYTSCWTAAQNWVIHCVWNCCLTVDKLPDIRRLIDQYLAICQKFHAAAGLCAVAYRNTVTDKWFLTSLDNQTSQLTLTLSKPRGLLTLQRSSAAGISPEGINAG